jgi:lysophospholipase L1-like esterase
LEGINDLGRIDDSDKQEQVITAEALVDSYRQMAERAHARGLKIIVGTLLPFKGAVYDSDDGQAKRLKVNAWIRDHASLFDGLIDFDTAMQEPGQPLVMRLTDQIGDHLHPNDDGYGRMARTALPVIETVDPCKK